MLLVTKIDNLFKFGNSRIDHTDEQIWKPQKAAVVQRFTLSPCGSYVKLKWEIEQVNIITIYSSRI